MKIRFILINIIYTLSIGLSVSIYASELPESFLYQEKSIDPLCFYQIQNTQDTLSLEKCGIKSEPSIKKAGENKQLIKAGFVGFDYTQNGARGMSYYKVFKSGHDYFLVYSINNGGGSGIFSSLSKVRRKGNDLLIHAISGGDRCNGGINNVAVKGKTLIYSVNITPYDFLELGKQNPHHLRAYDDLADCAACCQGVATFARRLDKVIGEERLISVNLLDVNEASKSSISEKPYQACFDKLIMNYQKRGQQHLTPSEFNQFLKTFNSQCFSSINIK
ncbi:hypothetical protein CbuD7D7780_04150 [Coxiella burnetii]|uniref:Uncharacterized protein n=1 Tax=Coxiella burnetii (strain Dugway 5J108-111) TaxID=434922 RepID=A9KDX1_COXBN|nr:hypothetical protein [Coxiella burnetii]ABS77384.2 hypothetical protein CBUD_0804 [Coxiella burnetii Dugway 5J108-111]OYK80468.1 hypothetical protein CbuD7E6568_04130 [Coxiella burnetii]OYK82426.1 hypothetical protein CbuD7D7780_04150 [Coxiella burnetii]